MLQTILIPRTVNLITAKKFLQLHGYKTGVDIKPNYFRFRQNLPVKGYYYTKKINTKIGNIEFVFVK